MEEFCKPRFEGVFNLRGKSTLKRREELGKQNVPIFTQGRKKMGSTGAQAEKRKTSPQKEVKD